MHSHDFIVFIISQDSIFTKQVRDRLDSMTSQIKTEYMYFEDGRSALSEVKRLVPHLIVAPIPYLGVEASHFESEMQRHSGSVTVVYLGQTSAKDIESTILNWPLTNWDQFLDVSIGAVPEEIKHRYQLGKRETELYRHLEEYGKKFISQAIKNQEIVAISMIAEVNGSSSDFGPSTDLAPGLSSNSGSGLSVGSVSAHRSSSSNPGIKDSEKYSNSIVSETYSSPRHFWIVEFSVICVVAIAATLSWEYLEDRIVSYLLMAVLGFLLFGLLLGRFFNPLKDMSKKL